MIATYAKVRMKLAHVLVLAGMSGDAALRVIGFPRPISFQWTSSEKPDDDFRLTWERHESRGTQQKVFADLKRNITYYDRAVYSAFITKALPMRVGDKVKIDLFDGWATKAVAVPWRVSWTFSDATSVIQKDGRRFEFPSDWDDGFIPAPRPLFYHYYDMGFVIVPPSPFWPMPPWLKVEQMTSQATLARLR